MRISVARAETEQEALGDGDDNTLWESAWSLVASINCRLLGSDPAPDPALLDVDMHDLWHMYWHGAINTAPGSPKLYRLALSIIQIREQGVLIRGSEPHSFKGSPTAPDQYSEDETSLARTSDSARIWTDLPFLVEDMTAHWTNSHATLSSAQRLSGAQFLSHMAAAGAVEDDALCGIALIVLREALETPRQLGRVTATERDRARCLHDLTVADLLPSANAWLFTTGRKLVQLSDDEWSESPADVGALGELVGGGGAVYGNSFKDVPARGGFSPQRWMWWLRRLEEITTLAEQNDRAKKVGEGGRSLPIFIRGVMDNMMLIAEQTNGAVARMAKADGGVRHRPVV
ncbi:hypothetical protein GE09DRAFT_1047543 [Coniochaeta sp. 2T2.1]|nr:hypothetical protein GE09DRAFT_1047543 [Coniochaeta sp. 2T2.1]